MYDDGMEPLGVFFEAICIFLLVGLVFYQVYSSKLADFNENSETVSANVINYTTGDNVSTTYLSYKNVIIPVDIKTKAYYVTVAYEVNGQEYVVTKETRKFYEKGSTITIRYSTKNYAEIKLE